jgi:hypothetical protein
VVLVHEFLSVDVGLYTLSEAVASGETKNFNVLKVVFQKLLQYVLMGLLILDWILCANENSSVAQLYRNIDTPLYHDR